VTKRRGHGEGSIYKAPDARWRGSVDCGWQDGKRKRKYVSGRTRNEVVAKLREAQRAADQGIDADGRLTVGAWLDHWLATVVDGRVESDNTRRNYGDVVRLHLVPGLGRIKLDKLTPEQVDQFLADKAAAGLSKSYVSRMRTVLTDALRHAERRGLVVRNAGALSVLPKMEAPAERQSFRPDQARALLASAEGERLEALVVIGLTCGFRPGELTGLSWQDLDVAASPPTLAVSGSMKYDEHGRPIGRGPVKRSRSGLRTVALAPVAVQALHSHRKRQLEERLAAGPLWSDHGLIFCSEIGTPVHLAALRRVFARIGRAAGVEGADFPYLLRHTAVSLLLDRGATIEEVADLLGDDPRTLYRHYRHKVRAVADAGLRMQKIVAG
jgi:integrase